MLRAVLFGLALVLSLSLPARAQQRATLLADSILVVAGNRLIAEGGVEIYYRGQRLTATRLVFDAGADLLTIEGPITLTDGKGTTLLADQAALSADLTSGILTSARLVLADQLQIAAAEVRRSDGGRLSGLVRVAASSCNICAGRPPLWEIRARSVLHDAEAQQLYFSGAQLRFAGVPVFYLPRLRLPDPSQDRASGFLVPRLSSSSTTGFGLSLPYFQTLGPSRDLTFTPQLTSQAGQTLTLRYRQAVTGGGFSVTGALSHDRSLGGAMRGYLAAEGAFSLPLGLALTGSGLLVSDRAYLSDYGISDKDRLDSHITLSHTAREADFAARIISFQSLRDGEDNESLPVLIGDVGYQKRFAGSVLGGQGGLSVEAHSHVRPSTDPADMDADGIADGRDLDRLSLGLDWRWSAISPGGIVLGAEAMAVGDYYAIAQDAVYGGRHLRLTGIVAAEIGYPMVRTGSAGASHLIEPLVQLVAAPPADDSIPNEDSALVEFDEGNLFALSRFPGSDAVEGGLHLNFGARYLYQDGTDFSLDLAAGRVLRLDDLGQFTEASGLSGRRSDWLLALSAHGADGLALDARILAGAGLVPGKADLRLSLDRARYGLSLGLTEARAEPSEGRDEPTRELVLDGRAPLAGNWTFAADSRLDLWNNQPTSAGASLEFLNECLKVDLSVSRRFTSSTSVTPATDFGLTVELLGFGGGTRGPSAQCRG